MFESDKSITLKGGPLDGGNWSAILYPPNGIAEFFRCEGEAIEVCRYQLVVESDELSYGIVGVWIP